MAVPSTVLYYSLYDSLRATLGKEEGREGGREGGRVVANLRTFSFPRHIRAFHCMCLVDPSTAG